MRTTEASTPDSSRSRSRRSLRPRPPPCPPPWPPRPPPPCPPRPPPWPPRRHRRHRQCDPGHRRGPGRPGPEPLFGPAGRSCGLRGGGWVGGLLRLFSHKSSREIRSGIPRLRDCQKSTRCARKLLELQSAFAGGISQSFDPAMIIAPAAVEGDFSYAHGFSTVGNGFADDLGRRDVGAGLQSPRTSSLVVATEARVLPAWSSMIWA